MAPLNMTLVKIHFLKIYCLTYVLDLLEFFSQKQQFSEQVGWARCNPYTRGALEMKKVLLMEIKKKL